MTKGGCGEGGVITLVAMEGGVEKYCHDVRKGKDAYGEEKEEPSNIFQILPEEPTKKQKSKKTKKQTNNNRVSSLPTSYTA